jgi:dTDP-4-amino-4,6-dideoxygalactose transaminase
MIPLFKVAMRDEAVNDYLDPVLRSGYIGEGDTVVEFEQRLAYELSLPSNPLCVNSCTSAIQLVLLSLGIGPGDEVITTPMTCIATNAPILMLGAKIVWADVDAETGNIDPHTIPKLITPRTKAIIAVDWTGRRCNYKLLRSFGLPVIEDAAHGPYIDISNCGDFVCFSFGPIKHLTCGDGGAIYVDNKYNTPLIEEMRLRRWYGLDRTSKKDFRCSQDIHLLGSKFHMNNINAAIGLANLVTLNSLVWKHRINAIKIHSNLKNKHIKVSDFVGTSDYWVFPIKTIKRDQLVNHLDSKGIMASRVHARNDKHPLYSTGQQLHCTNYFDDYQLNVPCGWWMTNEDVDHVIRTLNEWRPC